MTYETSAGVKLTQAALTALGAPVVGETVYTFAADVYEQYWLTGENTANGPGGVRVKIPAGSTKTASQLAAMFPAPTINTVTPASGTTGTPLRITGSNFSWAASASFGGTVATDVVVNEAGTLITCTAPAHAVGVVDVVVRTDATAFATKTGGYNYLT